MAQNEGRLWEGMQKLNGWVGDEEETSREGPAEREALHKALTGSSSPELRTLRTSKPPERKMG